MAHYAGWAARYAGISMSEISMRHVLRTCVSDTLIGAHFRNAEHFKFPGDRGWGG